MIDTIGGKVVLVSNQKNAVDFYVNRLGFEKRVDLTFGKIRWVEVTPKNSQSTISLMEPSPEFMTPEEIEVAKKTIGTPTGVWFYANDLEKTYQELKSKGVEVSEPKKQEWGGVMSSIKDQDGNEYQIISAPKT